jgi:hypothetical protein
VIDAQTGTPRLFARKDDAIWAGIGDAARFDDALGVDHPPFAFNSGMGWREVPAREWSALVASGRVEAGGAMPLPKRDAKASVPKAELPKGLSPELLNRLRGIATPAYRADVERRLRAA